MVDRSLLFDFPVGKRASTERRCSTLELPVVKRWTCEQMSYSGEKIRVQRVVQELCFSNDKVSSFKSYAEKYEVPTSVLNMCCENINTLRLKDVPDLCLQQKRKVETLPELKTNLKPLSSAARNLTHNIYRWRTNKTESKTKNFAEQGIYIFLALIFIVAAVVVCSSLYFASQQRVCEMTLDMGVLRTTLESNIFGQNAAVHNIMSVLNKFYNTHCPGIVTLAFAGGTGVGKSYTTSFISKLFPREENVQHFIWPLHSSSLSASDVYAKFSHCGANLVIIDDLVTSDAVNIAGFLQKVARHSQYHGVRAIVILVFRGEDQKLILQGNGYVEPQFQVMEEKVTSIFQDAALEVSFITFRQLQREDIVMCIQEAVNQQGIALLNSDIEYVMALLPQGTGCKGVASKVPLLSH